jgi:hypothetical protein
MKVMGIKIKISSCFQFRKIINELTYFTSKFNQRSYSRVHDTRSPWGVSPFCQIQKAALTPAFN